MLRTKSFKLGRVLIVSIALSSKGLKVFKVPSAGRQSSLTHYLISLTHNNFT
jgi:hypothetical protein